MNKLYVALRLLQLLNERRCITSAIVADDLDVSLRTAQRYLLELSGFPFVVWNERNNSYSLAPAYTLKRTLLSGVGVRTPGTGKRR